MIHRYSIEIGGSPGGSPKGEEHEVTVEPLEGGRFKISHGGSSRVVDARRIAESGRASTWSIVAEGGGVATLVDVDGLQPDLNVTVNNVTVPIKVVDARRKLAAVAGVRAQQSGPLAVKSPMPGKVVKVLVKPGDEVKAGQGVVVVEAMKMENELKSPRDGKVQTVAVAEGQAVESGQTLATLE
jgi:biotin carboxyl carrier protein